MPSRGWIVLLVPLLAPAAEERISIRGVVQTVAVYQPAQGPPRPAVVLSGGDGGWHGFIIDIAEFLARRGHFVVGVNSQAYLSSLSKDGPLEPDQIGRDYAEFLRLARERGKSRKVLLAGWSEGAGLSLLAAVDKLNQPHLAGLLVIGLPELNELAWHWRDSIIFLTRKVPNEKTFNSKQYIARAAPVPLVLIQATHDDFVPLATARELYRLAGEPKRFYVIQANSHRFSSNREEFYRKLAESLDWVVSLLP